MPAADSRSPGKPDHFPATQVSWIGRQLDTGDTGRLEVNRHIMQVYAKPLTYYFLGSRERWLGEPEELVNGFFADRLGQPDFLEKWRGSGKRLRDWLKNAFCFYMRERIRARHRGTAGGVPPAEEPATEDEAARAFDRALTQSMVRRALLAAEEQCAAEGLRKHWEVFERHQLLGQEYKSFARELGIEPARAVVMARTARNKFVAALRQVVAADAATPDVDDEIVSMLEDMA